MRCRSLNLTETLLTEVFKSPTPNSLTETEKQVSKKASFHQSVQPQQSKSLNHGNRK